MAIGTSNRMDYVGNGATATYPYNFKIFAATDLYVATRAVGAAADTLLTYPNDFTVTGVGVAAGGTMTLTAGVLATGVALAIRRKRPLSQSTTLSNQSAFFANVHEDSFDNFVMVDQQQQDQLDRSLHLPDSVAPSSVSMILPAPVANQALAWNNSASGFTSVPTSGITIAAFSSKIRIADVFSGATADAKIAAAHADLPAGGGSIDARGLEGAQSFAATVTVTKPTAVMIGASTVSFSGSTALFRLQAAGSRIVGVSLGATILTAPTGVEGIINEADNCTISDLTIRGPNTGALNAGWIGIDSGGRTGLVIERCIIENWDSHGINGGGASDYWRIVNCIVRNNYQDGILTGTGQGWLIAGNQVYGNGSNGIDVNGPRMRVLNNIVYSNGARYAGTGLDCDGILATSVGVSIEGVLISGNVVRANSCVGIRFRSDESRSSNNVTISNNIVSAHAGANGWGILLDTSVGATCGTVNDAMISGNQVYGNNKDGILVGGGAGAPCVVNRVNILENTVTGNTGTGIFVAYGNDAVVGRNTVVGNTTAQLNFGGSTRTVDLFNKIDTTNVLNFNGTLGVNTIQPYSSVVLGLTSTGNTEFDLLSTGAGRNNYGFYIDASGNFFIRDVTGAANRLQVNSTGDVILPGLLSVTSGKVLLAATAFAALGAGVNGTIKYCNDCTVANPCAGAGGGAFAKGIGGNWVCN